MANNDVETYFCAHSSEWCIFRLFLPTCRVMGWHTSPHTLLGLTLHCNVAAHSSVLTLLSCKINSYALRLQSRWVKKCFPSITRHPFYTNHFNRQDQVYWLLFVHRNNMFVSHCQETWHIASSLVSLTSSMLPRPQMASSNNKRSTTLLSLTSISFTWEISDWNSGRNRFPKHFWLGCIMKTAFSHWKLYAIVTNFFLDNRHGVCTTSMTGTWLTQVSAQVFGLWSFNELSIILFLIGENHEQVRNLYQKQARSRRRAVRQNIGTLMFFIAQWDWLNLTTLSGQWDGMKAPFSGHLRKWKLASGWTCVLIVLLCRMCYW